ISSEQPRGALAYAPKWARQQATEADSVFWSREDTAEDAAPSGLISKNTADSKNAAEQLAPVRDTAQQDFASKSEAAKGAAPIPAAERSAAAKPITEKSAAAKTTAAKGAASNKPWWRGKAPIFEGDSAIVELRERLKLAPDHVPEPPSPLRTTPVTFGAI